MEISFGTLTCARCGGCWIDGGVRADGRFVSMLGVLYATGWMFVKWHGLFVDG
jgi:hypothetical protein